ncbi:MAG: MATE family efflux transporter [Solirubrobacteraceae bacterium]|nr:MATE family efflux transporter [Solirubrobacteraceae bacterium]
MDVGDPAPGGPTARGASQTVIAQVGARLVSVIAVVGSTAIVVRTLGIEAYADWGTVVQLAALMAFAVDPGVSPIVVRRILQDPRTAPLPSALVPVRLALATLAFVVVVAVTVGLRGDGAALLAVALGAQVVPRALVLNATPWLQVDQRLHRQTALEALAALLGLALLGAAAAGGASAAVLGLVGFTVPTALLALLMRRELRITPSRTRDVPGPQRARVRSVVAEVAPLAGALVLVAVYMRIYVVFVNEAEDEATIGRFVFAFQFVDQLMVAAGIVAGAALPLLAVRATAQRLLRDHRTHDLVVAVTAVGALIGVGMIAVATLIVDVVGGPEAAGAERYLRLLAPIAPLLLASFVLAYVYVAIGQSRRYLVFNAVGLVVNLVAHALLTLDHGAEAAARITWGTEMVVTGLALAGITFVASGRRAAAATATVVVVVVVASELAAAGTVAPLVAAGGAGLVTVVVAHRPLRWMADAVGVPLGPLATATPTEASGPSGAA